MSAFVIGRRSSVFDALIRNFSGSITENERGAQTVLITVRRGLEPLDVNMYVFESRKYFHLHQ